MSEALTASCSRRCPSPAPARPLDRQPALAAARRTRNRWLSNGGSMPRGQARNARSTLGAHARSSLQQQQPALRHFPSLYPTPHGPMAAAQLRGAAQWKRLPERASGKTASTLRCSVMETCPRPTKQLQPSCPSHPTLACTAHAIQSTHRVCHAASAAPRAHRHTPCGSRPVAWCRRSCDMSNGSEPYEPLCCEGCGGCASWFGGWDSRAGAAAEKTPAPPHGSIPPSAVAAKEGAPMPRGCQVDAVPPVC